MGCPENPGGPAAVGVGILRAAVTALAEGRPFARRPGQSTIAVETTAGVPRHVHVGVVHVLFRGSERSCQINAYVLGVLGWRHTRKQLMRMRR